MKHLLENKAKKILTEFVDKKYSMLIKNESPDWFLRESSYGLEVVSATKEELIKLYKSLDKKKMSKGEIKNLEKLGIKTSNGFLSHIMLNPDQSYFEVLSKTIQLKNVKLIKNYKIFTTNDLFIFAFDPLIDINNIKEMVPKIIGGNEILFDHIMVCVDNNWLLIYEVKTTKLTFEIKVY